MKWRGWLSICAIIGVCLGNVEQDIASNQNKLANAKSQEKAINKKLDELGKAINAKNAELKELGKQIERLEKDILNNQDKSQSQAKSLQNSQQQYNHLLSQKQTLEAQMIKIISQSIAFYEIVMQSQEIDSPEGVVEYYIYGILHSYAKNHIKTLNAKQSIISNEIKKIERNITQIQNSIKTQTDKKERLQEAKEAQNVILANMQNELKVYNEKLKDVVKEREGLDNILNKLNITKEQKQTTSQQAFIKNQSDPQSIKAPKQFGTSYRNVPTIKYKGSKTFPPLDKFTIEKHFGPYFDPVYKFKIFNAAVMMNPKSSNANVKNVLDGKVVYAKDAPGLKKVVIIEHNNAIHTIYAYLDKIESSIKSGVKIKKGTIIGKVNERLSFEVTQKDKHINPSDFVRLN